MFIETLSTYNPEPTISDVVMTLNNVIDQLNYISNVVKQLDDRIDNLQSELNQHISEN